MSEGTALTLITAPGRVEESAGPLAFVVVLALAATLVLLVVAEKTVLAFIATAKRVVESTWALRLVAPL